MKHLFAVVLLLIAFTGFSAFTGGDRSEILIDGPASVKAPVGGAYLVFAGKRGGEIHKSELKGQSELTVDGCAKGARIFTFTLEINSHGKTQKLESKSNTLTSEMVAALGKLEVGGSFEFKSMQAYLANSKDVVDVWSQKFVVV